MVSIKIVSLNVRGLQSKNKRANVFRYLKELNVDMYSLYETHITKDDVKLWSGEWGSPIFAAPHKSNSAGVIILFNRKRVIQICDMVCDHMGQYIAALMSVNDYQFAYACLHAPNTEAKSFLQEVIGCLQSFEVNDMFVIGDFNCVLNTKLDRTSKVEYNAEAAAYLHDIIDKYEMQDVWRVRNPDEKVFSWNRDHPYTASRIDFMLCNNGLINKCVDIMYQGTFFSDHKALICELKVSNENRGEGYWKFNESLLNDELFVQTVKDIIIQAHVKYQHANIFDKWERLKYDIQIFAKKYGREKSVKNRHEFEKLMYVQNELTSKREADPENQFVAMALHETEKKIKEYVEERAKAAHFRSRARWDREGEKPTKYYLALERSNFHRKTLTSIQNADGRLVSGSNDILGVQKDFYEQLYNASTVKLFNLTNNTEVKVAERDLDKLNQCITYNEMDRAVKKLKKGKTPGGDGLTAEFYCFFWTEIKHILYQVFEYALECQQLPMSARRGIISLIPKKNRNLLLVKNWRPLTMLNLDYKILANILSERIKRVLNYIISDDQTGFMAGRHIASTIRKVIDFAELGQLMDTPGYIINADFEKCFDLITYQGINGSLRFFGFPDRYIMYVNLLLNNFESCVTNNGYFSEYFPVTRSCHQGCPLACNLMLLCGEVLAIHIRTNKNIIPYQIGELRQAICQYADDTQTLSKNDATSVTEIVNVFEVMQENIGLKVNYEKTVVHMIGDCNPVEVGKPFVWERSPPSLLGIEGSNVQLQYEAVIEKARSVLLSWSSRQTTVIGKVLVVNTLIASMFVYVMQTLPTPNMSFFDTFLGMIHKYLWQGSKLAKIPMGLLQSKKKWGGLQLVDIKLKDQSLKIPWILRNDMHSKRMLQMVMPASLGDKFLDCNLKGKHVNIFLKNKSTPFWQDVMVAWFSFMYKPQLYTLNEIKMQLIWCNLHILVGDRPLYNAKGIDAGLLYIYQLYESGQTLSEEKVNAYCISPFQYNQILSALPTEWKEACKVQSEVTHIMSPRERLKDKPRLSSYVYNELVENRICYFMKMLERVSKKVPVTMSEYQEAFLGINQISNITKYRDFQYRLLVLDVHANDRLYHWKIKSSQKCDWCDKKQDWVHMLFLCSYLRNFWHSLRNFVETCVNVDARELNWQLKYVFLNRVHNSYKDIVNFIVLAAKRYIFVSKCLKEPVKFDVFVKTFDMLQVSEKYNSIISGGEIKHRRKWAPYMWEDHNEVT